MDVNGCENNNSKHLIAFRFNITGVLINFDSLYKSINQHFSFNGYTQDSVNILLGEKS